MTDTTLTPPSGKTSAPTPHKTTSILELDPLTRKRNAAEARFKLYGIIAIGIGLFFLVALLWAILSNGLGAFSQTFLKVDVPLNQEQIAEAEKSVVKTSKYRAIIDDAFAKELAGANITTDMSEKTCKSCSRRVLPPRSVTLRLPTRTRSVRR